MTATSANAASRSPRLWILVFAISAAARVAIALAINDPIGWADAQGYHLLARNLAEHGVFSEDAPGIAASVLAPRPSGMREPGYPAFIALCYLVFGPYPLAAVIVQSILGAAGTVLLCVIVLRLAQDLAPAHRNTPERGSPRTPEPGLRPPLLIPATLLASLVVPLISTRGWTMLMREDLLTMLALLLVWLTLHGLHSSRRSAWLAAGVVLAAGTLIKTIFIVALPAVAIVLIVRLGWRIAVLRAGTMAAVTLVMLAPWMYRNAILFDRATLACCTGVNLYQHSGRPDIVDGVEPSARRTLNDLAERWPDVPDYPLSYRTDLATTRGWEAFCWHALRTLAAAGDSGLRPQHSGLGPESADAVLTRIVREDILRDFPAYLQRCAVYLRHYLTGGLAPARPPAAIPHASRNPLLRVYRAWIEPFLLIALQFAAFIGLFRARRSPAAWMLASIAVLTLLAHCLLVDAHLRHRVVPDGLLVALACVRRTRTV